tara:strand:+ start:1080 stop:1235 length:156 start_codon:yes stop_codon:yes gene_type:complete
MTSDSAGKVDVISKHETISDCHVALTMRGFDRPPENTYCLITEDGVDWKVE